MRFYRFLIIVFTVGFYQVPAADLEKTKAKRELIYVGTFSEDGSEGIYVFDFDRKANSYQLLQTIVSKNSPSFIAISPNGQYLVSANREGLGNKEEWGSVSLFSIDENSGKLSLLQDQSSFGVSPCHVSFHPSGRYVFLSHYQGGNFVVLPLDDSGNLGEPTANVQLEGKGAIMPRQEQPHTHSAVPSNDGNYLYVSDLGLDKILIYSFDEKSGKVSPAKQRFMKTNPGAGPRHFTFTPDGRFAFSAEEISSSIVSYKVDKATGSLEKIQRLSSLPSSYDGNNSTADIHTSKDGKYVYISNRGFDGLAIYQVSNDGKLSNVDFVTTVGKKPRNFLLEPNGEFTLVANRDSNTINIFRIESGGTLSNTDVQITVPAPVCVKYLLLK